MTAFNVVNPNSMIAGQPEDISVVLANFQAIAAILNGGIDNGNISPSAAITFLKLAGYPSDGTKFAAGDGTWKTPAVGVVSAQLAGSVNGDGTIAAGTGFTVVRASAGNYTVTFTTALATAPKVVGASHGLDGGFNLGGSVPTTAAFTCSTPNHLGVGQDAGFDFVAFV